MDHYLNAAQSISIADIKKFVQEIYEVPKGSSIDSIRPIFNDVNGAKIALTNGSNNQNEDVEIDIPPDAFSGKLHHLAQIADKSRQFAPMLQSARFNTSGHYDAYLEAMGRDSIFKMTGKNKLGTRLTISGSDLKLLSPAEIENAWVKLSNYVDSHPDPLPLSVQKIKPPVNLATHPHSLPINSRRH